MPAFHSPLFLCLLLTIRVTLSNTFPLATSSCYLAIFSFGDSITDTGNLIHSSLGVDAARFPYGETYFRHPTGRFSDGRVIVDFIAQRLGLPLLPPYAGGRTGHDFRQGVNFAVGGATALGNDFFREKGLDISWTNCSLDVQIGYFKQLLPSLCSDKSECRELLGRSLFLMGEIGGNDYNHAFFDGLALDEIQTFVPRVIEKIGSAINDLIELGARTILVPGNFPIGCVSFYLANYQSQRDEDYDPQTGCINWLNDFSEHHNRRLKEELDWLRRRHPNAAIIYADYYEATMSIFRFPHQLGLAKAPLEACCGGEGPYNFNTLVKCGDPAMKLCKDPSRYVCWDGLHLTEAAYKVIAGGILEGPYADPPIGACLQDISYQSSM